MEGLRISSEEIFALNEGHLLPFDEMKDELILEDGIRSLTFQLPRKCLIWHFTDAGIGNPLLELRCAK